MAEALADADTSSIDPESQKKVLGDIQAIPDEKELPLLFGYSVEPRRVYQFVMGAFVAGFVVNAFTDILYLCQPRTERRVYNFQIVRVSLIRKSCDFGLLLCLVFSGSHWRLDNRLNAMYAYFASFDLLTTWPKLRLFLAACGETAAGSLYLALFAALFFLVTVPCSMWRYGIDVHYGFINTFEAYDLSMFTKYSQELVITIIDAAKPAILVLPFLRCRHGWVVPWAGLNVVIILALTTSFGRGLVTPSDPKNLFPNATFVVGHGFPPLHKEGDKSVNSKWMSANRIYYQNETGDAPKRFETRDRSRGEVELRLDEASWKLSSNNQTYAEANTASDGAAKASAEGLAGLEWRVNGKEAPSARMGARKGGRIRHDILSFAKDRKIGIREIYMRDEGHKHTDANAYVTGIGSHRSIVLYDTLFLGSSPTDPDTALGELLEPNTLSEAIESPQEEDVAKVMTDDLLGVNNQEQADPAEPLWHSAQVEPMTDDEVVAILGHELGHSSLLHVEALVGLNVVTSLIQFGLLGFMAHSPHLAAAFSFAGPGGLAGVFLFQHVAGPPLKTVLNLFTNAWVRKCEYAADTYSASVSKRYAEGLKSSLTKLFKNAIDDPDYPFIYEALRRSHPGLNRRIDNIEQVEKEKYGSR